MEMAESVNTCRKAIKKREHNFYKGSMLNT